MTISLISLDGLPEAIEKLSALLADHGILILVAIGIWKTGPYLVAMLRRF